MTNIYRDVLRPLVFKVDAEKVHELGLRSLRLALASRVAQRIVAKRFNAPKGLESELFGLSFQNPIGIAAGFDKNGVAVDQLAALGFGFVEIGTVTQLPQPGNPKPRLFRLTPDSALINRLGFNNKGAVSVAGNLAKARKDCVIGVNIGRNKDVPNDSAVDNYLGCLEIVYDVADYITVNISSPNTPGLRRLQESKNLDNLLEALREKGKQLALGSGKIKPLLLKIAPDLSDEALDEVVRICSDHEVDGIIATNTTVGREGLSTPPSLIERIGAGGLSGKPLLARSTAVIRRIYKQSEGKLPIIGVGGIFDAADAFEKIAAGASLLQGYTGFVYMGPSYASEINKGLGRMLQEKGFDSLGAAVGSDY